ncbi:MAG TPA: glycosyltransferase, partial [bacterium]
MKVCLLTYRGNPFCGGQGVYAMALGSALARRGHEVHCVTGPPYPPPTPGVVWHHVPGLALFTGNGNGNGHPSFHDLLPLRMWER